MPRGERRGGSLELRLPAINVIWSVVQAERGLISEFICRLLWRFTLRLLTRSYPSDPSKLQKDPNVRKAAGDCGHFPVAIAIDGVSSSSLETIIEKKGGEDVPDRF